MVHAQTLQLPPMSVGFDPEGDFSIELETVTGAEPWQVYFKKYFGFLPVPTGFERDPYLRPLPRGTKISTLGLSTVNEPVAYVAAANFDPESDEARYLYIGFELKLSVPTSVPLDDLFVWNPGHQSRIEALVSQAAQGAQQRTPLVLQFAYHNPPPSDADRKVINVHVPVLIWVHHFKFHSQAEHFMDVELRGASTTAPFRFRFSWNVETGFVWVSEHGSDCHRLLKP
jgi:hypothetical protein